MPEQHLVPIENALRFIKAGNALFTVASKVSEKRHTFKVLSIDGQEGFFKVLFLNGPDNTSNYKYLGIIDPGQMHLQTNSIHMKENKIFQFFDVFHQKLMFNFPMDNVQIFHCGRCARCGRLLTVPESVVSGYGPECILYI